MRVIDFEPFDPLTGTPPDHIQGYFSQITQRARRQLAQRSTHEVDSAVGLLSWLLSQDWLREDALSRLAEEMEENDAGDSVLSSDFSDIENLRQCVERIDLGEQEIVPGITWADLFALLALVKVADASWWVQHYAHSKKDETDWIIPQTLGPFAVEAMEAVCLAEHYAQLTHLGEAIEQRVQEDTKAKLSLRNQKASIARHQKTNQLIRELHALYREKNHETYAEAVQAFLERIPEERIRHLARTNRSRTLREGLSAVCRGKRSLIE